MKGSRLIALQRAGELRQYNVPFEEARKLISRGTDATCIGEYEIAKVKLLSLLDGDENDWNNWEWQLEHRIDDVETLAKILPLTSEEQRTIRTISEKYRWAITPYYLALIDPQNPLDPIRQIAVPASPELDDSGYTDPMNEEFTSPAGVITRRYPDRLIINVTNSCPMFCRHCQRRRRIGEFDSASASDMIEESIDYVRRCNEIRDVLITGGDPLTLSNEFLEDLLSKLRAIEHVEIIRFGTRVPVTMPQRIDDGFIQMIQKYHPVFINTQFNHPKELTPEAIAACARLANAGVPLGNQMVLLNGVNNDKYIVRVLNHEMLKARVRPYYIFHPKEVVGTSHFLVSVDQGIEIMDHLRGYTSGMAIPTYIINAPGGLGKIPILPDYIVDKDDTTVTLRTWEGKIVEYPNHH